MITLELKDIVMSIYSVGVTILSISSIIAYRSYKNQVKKLKETISKIPKKTTIDFEKDIKCLDISMKNNVDYFVNNLLSPLMSKQDGGFLKDSDIKEIVTEITLNVVSELSDDYIKSLSFYINDLESYIAKRINERITPYIVKLNVHKLGK